MRIYIYKKKTNNINPLINGGSQEFGFRAGTQNIAAIMGMAKAAEIVNKNMKNNYQKVFDIKQRFIEKLNDIEDITINSLNNDYFSPYILNVSFKGIKGEVLLHFLEEKGIYISTGSACSSKEREKIGGS